MAILWKLLSAFSAASIAAATDSIDYFDRISLDDVDDRLSLLQVDAGFALSSSAEVQASVLVDAQLTEDLSLIQAKTETEADATESAATEKVAIKHTSDLGEARAATYYNADWKTGRQRMVFVHIPKNAGTAIEEAGAKGKIWWPRKWLSFWHGLTMPDGSQCEKYHVPPAVLEQMKDKDSAVFTEDGTFCVTRNPYERVVSEYLYMIEKPWGAGMSKQYGTGLLDQPRCSAEGMNNFIQKAMRVVQEGKKYIHDCHFVPQYDFVWGPDGRRWCQHTLKSENLAVDFNALMTENGMNVRLKEGRTNNSTGACPGISQDSLTAETRRIVEDVYARDFEHFDYKREMKPLLFMRIPKNSGFAIEEAGKAEGVKFPVHWDSFQHRMPMKDYSWCEKYHVPLKDLSKVDQKLFENAEVFCVTRHPYQRAVAEYRLMMTAQDGKKESNYYGTGLTEIGEDCSAEQMNFFLQRTIKLMMAGQKYALDCRMLPQTEYMFAADDSKQCDFSLRAEQFPSAYNKLMVEKGYVQMQFDKAPDPEEFNATCSGLTQKDLAPETLELLNHYYDSDFQKLGYEMTTSATGP